MTWRGMSDSVERVIGNKKELSLPAEGRGVEAKGDIQQLPKQPTNTEPSSTDENNHLPNDKA